MRIELFTYEATLQRPVVASSQRHSERKHVFCRITHNSVEGWGEVSPQPINLFGDPSVDAVIEEFCTHSGPQFLRVFERETSMPHWSRIARFQGSRSASPTAQLVLEMAALDWTLRSEGAHIRDLWSPAFDTPVQRTLGLGDEDMSSFDTAARLRVKVGRAAIEDSTLRFLESAGLPVVLDYNCCEPLVPEVVAHLAQCASIDVVAIEQPYLPGNVVDHALLRTFVEVDISLDEGVRSLRDLDHIRQYGAASMVCIKPARLGGYSVARSALQAAQDMGLRAYVGGFFESPLGRAANRALANCSTDEPSDIGKVTFAGIGDVWHRVGDGFGVIPSPLLLERFTTVFAWEQRIGGN